jgi:hypothetical protein
MTSRRVCHRGPVPFGLSELSGRESVLKIHFLCFPALAFLLMSAAPSLADTANARAPAQPPLNDFAGQIMSNGKTGRVGIGTQTPAATLEVYKGEIKLGSTGAACTKELTGTIRFADDQLWVCNSTGWRAVLVSAAPK